MLDPELLPLIGASLLLLALIAGLGLVIYKFRSSAKADLMPSADRLSEEAFAAATISAALAGRTAPAPSGTASAGAPAADGLDAAVLESLDSGLLVTDEAGVVRRVNAAARAALRIVGPGTGHPYRTSLTTWPGLIDALARVHAGEGPVTVDLVASGETTPAASATVARWTPRHGRGGAVAVVAAAAPADAAGPGTAAPPAPDAATADAAGGLASGLAHELANSLTTVHGYAHLVDRSGLGEADRAALDHIKTSAEKMLLTVDRFRSLVRPLPITPTVFAPADAVAAAIRLACQEADAPEDAVTLSAAPTDTVRGDRVLLEEAIAALVRNAIEASRELSPPPVVDVRVGAMSGGGRVEIVVTDRGRGVPAEIRHRLFQPFFSEKTGHDGFGLARAAHILRAHPDATIALSHPPTGLVVTVGLPAFR
jgi:signal transduction histidine kinase